MAGILPAATADRDTGGWSPTIGIVAESSQGVRGIILDWGGVLTNPILDVVQVWLRSEQIDADSYLAAMRPWIQQAYGPGGGESPVHALERGEVPDSDFEQILAALLVTVDGGPVAAAGLLRRMFAASALQDDMLDLVRELRHSGLRTGLLSNSWGISDSYPRHLFSELFDDVVISGEVGMRKPEERIFSLAAGRLGLAPEQCVFIDDVEGNITAARAFGFMAVHHREPALTCRELSRLLDAGPAAPAPGAAGDAAPIGGTVAEPTGPQ
jgi:putative hydrolase of the HAD superfamily